MSRLRNRIRKADYFTDGELLRWPRDKRATYSGLWALAEDSGCLEDDCFEWKMSLWPSPLDADITIEMLEQWRDELIEAGKLIPYEADGKRYLFLRNFHQHEKPTNPQRPDLPTPPWVRAEVAEGRSKDGKKWSRCAYVVCADLMPQRNGVCTDSVQTQHARIQRSPVLSSPDQSRPDQDGVKEPPLPPKPVENEEDKSGLISEVQLTQGKRAVVDTEDIERLAAHSWYAIKSGERTYAGTKAKGGVILMHRFIMGLGIDWDGCDVHHKDGDGLNNRKSNLETLSRSDHVLTHNSAEPERVDSHESEEQEQEPVAEPSQSCDGAECHIRSFPASAFAPLRKVIMASDHGELWAEVGKGGDFDRLLASYAEHLCAACQAGLAEYERPQLEELCERALCAAVEGLRGSQDVAAVMRSRLQRWGLAEIVGDRVLEELRRSKRDKRRRGEPRRIGEALGTSLPETVCEVTP